AWRMSYLEGSSFELDLKVPYEIILFPNFLHHFDKKTIEAFLKKVRAALAPGGKAATVEFVPNEDRVSPPVAAAFSLQMLAATSDGDAYTARELTSMFEHAGFSRVEVEPLTPMPSSLVIAT
ncbi:MAG: methyltransferase, partial [Vulcanimicrobiaceae bacterium]